MGARAVQGFFVAVAVPQGEAIVSEELQTIRVELKYCEACGALWLRPRGSQTPYCRRCENVMAVLSRTDRKKPAERRRP